MKVDPLLVPKILKRHFLRDIEKSFQEVAPIGPEPHHFFPFQNISTNTVARDIQSFARIGPWLAGEEIVNLSGLLTHSKNSRTPFFQKMN